MLQQVIVQSGIAKVAGNPGKVGPEGRRHHEPPHAKHGTKQLADNALKALEGRTGCLLANHGVIATGTSIDKAMWLAVELETIAKQYYYALMLGGPHILSDALLEETHKGFATYGLQDEDSKPKRKRG